MRVHMCVRMPARASPGGRVRRKGCVWCVHACVVQLTVCTLRSRVRVCEGGESLWVYLHVHTHMCQFESSERLLQAKTNPAHENSALHV